MKKIIAFLMLLSLPAFGQNKDALLFQQNKKFFGGVILGLNVSQVDGDSYSGFHKAGLHTGGLVYWFFTKDVAASLEFLYSQKGSHGVTESYSPYSGPYFAKYKLKLNYVEVPLVFHYLFNEKKYLLGLGGSFNALLGEKETFQSLGVSVGFDAAKAPFNDFTVDIIGSLGMNIWKNIIVEARYEYGLTPVRDKDNVYPFISSMGGRDEFDNLITFRVIYLF